MGKGSEQAYQSGADFDEGFATGAATATWEGLQWYIGMEIGKWNPIKGNGSGAKILNSILRVGADSVDGAVEGFAQPFINSIYQDGTYGELFEAAGGWTNVGIQGAVGAAGSLIGEVFDLGKYFGNKNNSDIDTSGAVKNVSAKSSNKHVAIEDNLNSRIDGNVKPKNITLEDLKYEPAGIVESVTARLESNVRKYVYTDTNAIDGLNKNIMDNGLYHFTDAADKILESGYIKATDEALIGPLGYLGASYGNPKSFFFSGIPEVGNFATNLDSVPLKTTAVKVQPNVDIVNSSKLKVRNLDDGAITYDGRFDLSTSQASKEYFCLVRENDELVYKPVSKEVFDNYENTIEGQALAEFLKNKKNVQAIKDDYLVGLSAKATNAKVSSGNSLVITDNSNVKNTLDDIMNKMGNSSGRRALVLCAATGNVERIPIEFRSQMSNITATDINNYFGIEKTNIGTQFFANQSNGTDTSNGTLKESFALKLQKLFRGSTEKASVDTSSVKPNIPTPEYIKNVDELGTDIKQEWLRMWSEKLGATPEVIEEAFSKRMAKVIEDSDFGIRITDNNLYSVLKDGRFKNQFETGKSNGILDFDARSKVENNAFNVPMDINASDRPVYGMLFPSTEQIDNDVLAHFVNPYNGRSYGDTVVILKKENIIGSTTLTVGDSLRFEGKTYATLASNPQFSGSNGFLFKSINSLEELQNADLSTLSSLRGGHNSYVEIQLHGSATHTIDNIEKIIFMKEPDKKLINLMKKKGINWEILPSVGIIPR